MAQENGAFGFQSSCGKIALWQFAQAVTQQNRTGRFSELAAHKREDSFRLVLKPAGKSRFRYERELLARGCAGIAGVDEAGRGPLAGPVVAAAVVFSVAWITDGLPRALWGLNDSKQLEPEEREKFYSLLTAHPEIRYAIAACDHLVIDEINILQATFRAMNQALSELTPQPDHVLVDGNQRSSLRWVQSPIIDGDAKSYSIAAASVLAKVTRDRMMVAFDRDWPQYGFAEHKGYSTERHLTALAQHGPCPLHRRSFAPIKPQPLPAPELFPPPEPTIAQRPSAGTV